jgi:putative heme iron utilization protein
VNRRDRAAPARELIQVERHGVLCTLSRQLGGWPFASLTPYAFAASGEPLFLISNLAEHTRNLRADPRVSLFIQDSSALAHPQAGARITIMGLAKEVDEDEIEDARRRYLARLPEGEGLFQMADFALFKLQIERVRFIGGFGEIFWLNPEELLLPPSA